MNQKIRLLATRNDVSYSLDLQDAPNISLNFKFSDIQDISKKKSSFSQTFMLPFTDNNKKYFQNWNHVSQSPIATGFGNEQNNPVSLYVNDLEQFKGFLVLKNVLQDRKLFEVMILSNVANLYSTMGQKTITNAFQGVTKYNHTLTGVNIQASWNNTLGADFDDTVADTSKIIYPIFSASMPMIWNSTNYLNENNSSTSYNIQDQQEGDNSVQIVAPGNRLLLQEQKPAIQLRTVLEQIFESNGFTWTSTFFDSVYFRKLYMTTCNHLDSPISAPPTGSDSGQGMPPLVYGKWGYTAMRGAYLDPATGFTPDIYTKIWALANPSTQTYQNLTWTDSYTTPEFDVSGGNLSVNLDGSLNILDNGNIIIPTYQGAGDLSISIKTMVSVVCRQDSNGNLMTPFLDVADSTVNEYQASSGAYQCYVGLQFRLLQFEDIGFGVIPLDKGSKSIVIQAGKVAGGDNDTTTQQPDDLTFNNINYDDGTAKANGDFMNVNINFTNTEFINSEDPVALFVIPFICDGEGNSISIGDDFDDIEALENADLPLTVLIGKPGVFVDTVTSGSTSTNCCTTIEITGNTQGGFNPYNQTVDIPSCFDPSTTQKDFLKDLSDRFNLVMQTDPDTPSNLLVEPMQDFLNLGTTKFWTDKIDLSKEVRIKPTSSLRFNKIEFTDKEDTDFMNKFVKQYFPEDNVLGNYKASFDTGAYANGKELKNKPLFSPYIVEEVPKSLTDSEVSTYASRLALHRGYSYDDNGNITYGSTNPKLFYYGGRPVPLIGNPSTPNDGVNYNLWLWWGQSDGDGYVTWNKHLFNEYPLCSAYQVDRDVNDVTGTTGINENTKVLRWNCDYVFGGTTDALNWNEGLRRGFYELYWRDYLGQIYHQDSRIMTCYIRLNEIDIANFKFNDQIFIKDSYWRIMEIQNYQAGTGVSVKVKLIKVVETEATLTTDCNYFMSGGTWNSFFYIVEWTNINDPSDVVFYLDTDSCCNELGGTAYYYGGSGYICIG
tara:strand:- start:13905 stop:16895 length:2991 start_codon:yes stop_codon:yes gene_type:complete